MPTLRPPGSRLQQQDAQDGDDHEPVSHWIPPPKSKLLEAFRCRCKAQAYRYLEISIRERHERRRLQPEPPPSHTTTLKDYAALHNADPNNEVRDLCAELDRAERARDGSLVGTFTAGGDISFPSALAFDGAHIWVASSGGQLGGQALTERGPGGRLGSAAGPNAGSAPRGAALALLGRCATEIECHGAPDAGPVTSGARLAAPGHGTHRSADSNPPCESAATRRSPVKAVLATAA